MGLLRELFGSSREEIWRQLSTEIGADFVAGGFWKGDNVTYWGQHNHMASWGSHSAGME